MIEKIIKSVMELPGVDGACILDKKGELLINELPDFFLDDFLDDLARRIKTLYEAVDENYTPCDDYLLKFPEKYIRLRRSRNVFLLIVVDPSVNLVSLKMVSNIVLKHITPKVLGDMRKQLEAMPIHNEELPEVSEPQSSPAPSTVPLRGNKVARPRPMRSFRGAQY